ELPASIERERLRPASWSSYGAQGVAPRGDVPSLSTGDSVRHGTLGEGVVTQIEAGGVVTVRFADGNERRLMLDYAPLERIPKGPHVSVEIRNPSEDELRKAMKAVEAAFGEEQKEEDLDRHQKAMPRDRFLVAYDGEVPVGTTASLPFELTVPGGELAAG